MGLNAALYTISASTVGSTEYSIVNDSTTIATDTTACVASLWVDAANMAAGDEFEIAMREKVIAGGTQRRIVLGCLVGAQAAPFVTGPFELAVGWDFTIQKIAGTDRAFDAAVRAVT